MKRLQQTLHYFIHLFFCSLSLTRMPWSSGRYRLHLSFLFIPPAPGLLHLRHPSLSFLQLPVAGCSIPLFPLSLWHHSSSEHLWKIRHHAFKGCPIWGIKPASMGLIAVYVMHAYVTYMGGFQCSRKLMKAVLQCCFYFLIKLSRNDAAVYDSCSSRIVNPVKFNCLCNRAE